MPQVVIRRRGGVGEQRIEDKELRQHLASASSDELAFAALRVANQNMRAALEGRRSVHTTKTLWDSQQAVFAKCGAYLDRAVVHVMSQSTPCAFGRIIQPPRTGKTIVIGELVSATGANALVLAPTVKLVNQLAERLHEHLPTIPIGVWHGQAKELRQRGITVMTYTSLQLMFAKDGQLPPELRYVTLVFADEAHHNMTAPRMAVMRDGFSPATIRIALTASPDYNEKKVLADHFPELIQEITVREANYLGLFAPLKYWIVGVDADASKVDMSGADFNAQALERLVVSLPYCEAAREWRYRDENRNLPALICCPTQQAARDMFRYLNDRKPEGSKHIGLVISEIGEDVQQYFLEGFETGTFDTLVTVRILTEGWDAPQLKLLIDCAPSMSAVQGRQKYFRPLTRFGDAEARIVVLLPKNLPRVPYLPAELFGRSVAARDDSDLLFRRKSKRPAVHQASEHEWKLKYADVDTSTHPMYEQLIAPPKLDPDDESAIRKVIESAFEAEVIPSYPLFRRTPFDCELFQGYGEQLLRYCGARPGWRGYLFFMMGLYPELGVRKYVRRSDGVLERSCDDDVELLLSVIRSPEYQRERGPLRERNVCLGYEALCANMDEPMVLQDELIERSQLAWNFRYIFRTMTPDQEFVVRTEFGLDAPELNKWGQMTALSPEKKDFRAIQDERNRLRTRVEELNRILHDRRGEAVTEEILALDRERDEARARGHELYEIIAGPMTEVRHLRSEAMKQLRRPRYWRRFSQ